MSADALSTFIIALAALITAIASNIRGHYTRQTATSARQLVDEKLEDCEAAKDALRKDLKATQKDRDELAIRVSALESENVMLARLLPGGDIARRLGFYEGEMPRLQDP